MEDDGDGEAGDGGAWLVGERKVHCQDVRLIINSKSFSWDSRNLNT